MNVFNIQKAFQDKKERGWKTIYVAVDAHGTLIKSYHNTIIFYPDAIEVMKWFNSRSDFKVILWTSSHVTEIEDICKEAEKLGIRFDFFNENPLEKNSKRANFNQKFYFNVMIDNKAGMEPTTDWKLIKKELIRIGEWDKA